MRDCGRKILKNHSTLSGKGGSLQQQVMTHPLSPGPSGFSVNRTSAVSQLNGGLPYVHEHVFMILVSPSGNVCVALIAGKENRSFHDAGPNHGA